MIRFACIGSRKASREMLEVGEILGFWIVNCEGELHSGNAVGMDQAFARGANQVDPRLVHLHLPWKGYNQEAIVPGNKVHLPNRSEPEITGAVLAELHPFWHELKNSVKLLHWRNMDIILPDDVDHVRLCIAAPDPSKSWGGGTGMGMKIAERYGIEVVNINNQTNLQLSQLCQRIRELCHEASRKESEPQVPGHPHRIPIRVK